MSQVLIDPAGSAQPAAGAAITILGAGSIGAYMGGCLLAAQAQGSAALAQVRIQLIGRARMRDRLAAHGLHLSDLRGQDQRVTPQALPYTDASDPLALAQVLAQSDLVLLTVKSADVLRAAQTLAEHLKPGALVCCLQNGVGQADRLRAILPQHRVVAGMVPFNVVQLEGGRLHRGTAGELMVQADPAWARWLEGFAAARLPLTLRHDMRAVQWGKLLLNLNNAINALSGLPLKTQLAQRGYRRVLAQLIDEALAALRAAGIAAAQVGRLPPARLPFVLRLPDWLFSRIAAGLLKIDPQARSSMWEDLMAGRLTEVDELNGAVVELADAHALDAPLNRAITALVHQAEQGGRRDWKAQELLQVLSLSPQP